MTNPVAARLSVSLGTDALEDGLDAGPGSRGAARHEGGAVPRTILPSTHSTPDKQETLLCQSLAATLEANQTKKNGNSLRVGRKKIPHTVDVGFPIQTQLGFLIRLCTVRHTGHVTYTSVWNWLWNWLCTCISNWLYLCVQVL